MKKYRVLGECNNLDTAKSMKRDVNTTRWSFHIEEYQPHTSEWKWIIID